MKTLIIIPTYNEADNIAAISSEVLGMYPDVEVLVVDDSSPDGTGDVVKAAQENEKRLHLLSRPGKSGLGKAYLAGFSWGIDHGFDQFIEMDADFSHRPQDVAQLLNASAEGADFVIGSRYIPGGRVANWGFIRKCISKGGSFYTRAILGYPLKDWTGGFNLWKKHVLEGFGLDTVRSEGYSFQIELKYKALKNNFKGVEVPIVFEDRRVGESKMSSRIFVEALYRVWQIRA